MFNLSLTLPGPFLIHDLPPITEILTRLTRRVPLVEQELITFPEHLSSPPLLSGIRVTRSYSPFVFFFWPLCCLFFDIRILITPLVSLHLSVGLEQV